jgi:GDP-L-fucose synthase
MNKKSKIYIAGHKGMLGSAIVRSLNKLGFENLILKTRQELDLIDPVAVSNFFKQFKPEIVILGAAKVGGIQANIDFPADFLYINLQIQNNVIHNSYLNGVKKICFLGSSCIYPKNAPQPIKEEYLMTDILEPTNESYALAKICGLKLMSSYEKQYNLKGISVMPCNLYGTNDNFDPEYSHVLSALVKKFVDAKENNLGEVTLMGTGIARREFMHVDDAAAAVIFLLDIDYKSEHINIGWGHDLSIKELASLVSSHVGFEGTILWDSKKPDGMLRKCMDVKKMLNLGFKPKINLDDGIKQTIKEYKKLQGHIK